MVWTSSWGNWGQSDVYCKIKWHKLSQHVWLLYAIPSACQKNKVVLWFPGWYFEHFRARTSYSVCQSVQGSWLQISENIFKSSVWDTQEQVNEISLNPERAFSALFSELYLIIHYISLVLIECTNVFDRSLLWRPILQKKNVFQQKYCKHRMWKIIQFKIPVFYVNIFSNVFYFWSKVNFPHHYSSLQCHMIFRNHYNMLIYCSRSIYYYHQY